jgi:acetyltransferase-like isoleucine patch superfamily enzyme
MKGFYSEAELDEMGFQSLGTGVLISTKASIYGVSRIRLGNNIRIDDFVSISASKYVEIQDNVHIGSFSYMAGQEDIILEKNVGISQGVRIYSTVDDFLGLGLVGPMIDIEYRRPSSGPVRIKKYSVIGSGSTILPGVTIGFNSGVGAMSLVNTDIPDHKLAHGIPAKPTLNRSKSGYKRYEQSNC